MSRQTLRLGYVGCGFMAQKVHLPNFASIPECELVALAEVRPRLGEKVRERYRIPKLYRHHTELAADPDLDAVALSAGFALQGEIARDLLAAGKHVFMEKPMAVSVAQAERILEAARATGARLMVGYMKRYDAGNELVYRTLREFQASDELGAITYARNHGFGGDWVAGLDTPLETTDEPAPPSPPPPVPDWLPERWVQPYIGFLQQYTHNINLLRWFLDAEDAAEVRAVDLDDNGYSGVVVFRINGVRAVLETGGISHHRWDEHTQIYFQHGWVHTWAPPPLLRSHPATVEIYRAGETQTYTHPLPKDRWSWAFRREAEHFVRTLLTEAPFRSPGEDTLHDVQTYENIYRRFLEERGELP